MGAGSANGNGSLLSVSSMRRNELAKNSRLLQLTAYGNFSKFTYLLEIVRIESGRGSLQPLHFLCQNVDYFIYILEWAFNQ